MPMCVDMCFPSQHTYTPKMVLQYCMHFTPKGTGDCSVVKKNSNDILLKQLFVCGGVRACMCSCVRAFVLGQLFIRR